MSASRALVIAVVGAVCAALLVYSQTLAYYGDEGFDLLAAQLILAGKKPYIDFFYQHTPLFTCLVAGAMKLFGPGWRGAHLLSALFTSGAIVLASAFVHSRLTAVGSGWRATGVIATALLIGSQAWVMKYATTSQAYGACLFFSVGAFWLAIIAIEQAKAIFVFGSGLCAGAAAASSLLTVPVAPVVLFWLLWRRQSGARLVASVWFLAGALIPFLPLLWLLWMSPRQVLFDLALYHLFYRGEGWPIQWDLSVYAAWLSSAQAGLLALVALVGLLFAFGIGRWPPARRAELGLCAALSIGLTAFAAVSRPTFEQYFILAFPFAAILAAVGVYAIGSQVITSSQRPWLALMAIAPLLIAPTRLVHSLAGGAERPWQILDAIGAEINRVTPQDGTIWANHIIYAAARRVPPAGLESAAALHLTLSPADRAALHIVSTQQVEEWLHAGRFDTVCNCEGSERVRQLGLSGLYRQHVKVRYIDSSIKYCDIFWDRVAR